MDDLAPEPDWTQLRVAFNRARHTASLTFDQLAERSGVSRQTLINLSQGRHIGDLRTWVLLAAVFDVALDDLLAPIWGEQVASAVIHERGESTY